MPLAVGAEAPLTKDSRPRRSQHHDHAMPGFPRAETRRHRSPRDSHRWATCRLTSDPCRLRTRSLPRRNATVPRPSQRPMSVLSRLASPFTSTTALPALSGPKPVHDVRRDHRTLPVTCQPSRASPAVPKHDDRDALLLTSRRSDLSRCGHPAASGPKPFHRVTRPRPLLTTAKPAPLSHLAGPKSCAATKPYLVRRSLDSSAVSPRDARTEVRSSALRSDLASPDDAPVRTLSATAPKRSRGPRLSRSAGPAPRPPLARQRPDRSPLAIGSACGRSFRRRVVRTPAAPPRRSATWTARARSLAGPTPSTLLIRSTAGAEAPALSQMGGRSRKRLGHLAPRSLVRRSVRSFMGSSVLVNLAISSTS